MEKQFFVIGEKGLVHARCAYCEKICGCRVQNLHQRCASCQDTYCSLPKLEEWRICPVCTNKLTEGT